MYDHKVKPWYENIYFYLCVTRLKLSVLPNQSKCRYTKEKITNLYMYVRQYNMSSSILSIIHFYGINFVLIIRKAYAVTGSSSGLKISLGLPPAPA